MRESDWNQLRWLSLILTVLVIFAHAYNAELFLGGAGPGSFAGRLERLIGADIAQIAVPGFFMISAALFFRDYGGSREETLKKWGRRAKSLCVPYLLWNLLYYLGYLLASRAPGLSGIVGKGRVPFDLRFLFRAVFFYEYNYVFWYVFQLILLTALSPVIFRLIRRRSSYLLSAALLCLVIALRFDPTPLNSDALLYYMSAARLSYALRKGQKYGRGLRGAPFGAAAAAALFFCLSKRTGNDLFSVLYRMSAVLFLALQLRGRRLPELRGVLRETFLIYALHFAPVRLITKSLNLALHGSEAAALFIYLLMPLFIALISAAAERVGKCLFPRFYGALTGGRGERPEKRHPAGCT